VNAGKAAAIAATIKAGKVEKTVRHPGAKKSKIAKGKK